MTAQPAGRRNIGGLSSRQIPADRYIVAGAFVLLDDAGNHTVYFHQQPAMGPYPSSQMPEPEVQLELAAMLATAWDVANVDTHHPALDEIEGDT